jgi:tetratricopeptide (TPR) repeat protein
MITKELCENEISQNPNNAEIYLTRGDLYYQEKEYGKALQDYEKAIELGEDLEDDVCYKECLDYKKSKAEIEQLTKKINENPQDINNYMARAYYYSLNKEYNKAIGDISKAIEISPNATLCHVRRQLCEDLIEYDLKEAIELATGKEKVSSYWCRANFYKEKYLANRIENEEFIEKAEQDYDEAIKYSENKMQANFEKSNFYADIEDKEKAIEYCQKAVEIADRENEILYLSKYIKFLCELYYESENYKKTIETATQALEIETEEHAIMDLLCYRIESYKAEGKEEEAKDDEKEYQTILKNHKCNHHHNGHC